MKIKSGDTILLIATARFVTPADVKPFLQWADEKGLIVEVSPNLFKVENQFAGSDEDRAQDLLWAFTHPSATAVFCARGGYGTLRTVKKLEEILAGQGYGIPLSGLIQQQWNRKLRVGFSDVTVLHSLLNKYQWVSLHAPVAVQWGNPSFDDSLLALEEALFRGTVKMDVFHLNKIHDKPFSGKLLGGNLSLIYALLATPYSTDWQNAVLLIEDVDEYLYHIDRMLQSLDSAGVFRQLTAIIVGGMSDMKDNALPFGMNAQK